MADGAAIRLPRILVADTGHDGTSPPPGRTPRTPPVVDQRLDTGLHIGSAHAVILSSTDRPKRVTRSSAGDEPSGKQRAESADRPDKRDGQAHEDGQGGRDEPGGQRGGARRRLSA